LSDAELERFEGQLESELLPLPLGTLGRNARGVVQLCDAPWETVYLHTDHSFQRVCQSLATKLVALAHRVDAAQGWGLLSAPAPATMDGVSDAAAPARLRVVELHSVTAGGGLADPTHVRHHARASRRRLHGRAVVHAGGGWLLHSAYL
jgi:hypothetical protein